jgi:hypothetical protein
MLFLALLAAAQPALVASAPGVPTPGPIKAFGNWAVACDNVHACEMTSLTPDDPIPEGDEWGGMFSISRAPGPAGGYTIEISSYRDLKGEYSVRVDGKVITGGMPKAETITFRGAPAEQIVAAIIKGKEISLTDIGDGLEVKASLAGSSAALRFIDAEQGRAGTVSAAVAKGSKPATAVPLAQAYPVARFVRPSGKPAAVNKALRAAMDKQGDCDGIYEGSDGGPPPVDTYALGGGKTLALLPCGSGAYNYSSIPFILGGPKPVIASFDLAPGETQAEGQATLVNAGWNAKTAILSSYAKGRGVGDCGDAQEYVWDGAMFRLIAARQMDECRGSVNWLTVWKAIPTAQ